MSKKKSTEPSSYAPRERGLKRRDIIFDAATRAFVRDGYKAMSLKDLVAETGGSMTTLYQHFGNKEKLFQAVIDSKYEAIYADSYAFELDGMSIEAALREVGYGVMRLVTSEEAINLYRMIIVEAEHLPDVRRRFVEMVLDRGKKALAGFLEKEVAAGRIEVSDCTSAAALYFGMVRRDLVIRSFLGDDPAIDTDGQDKIVNEAVEVFLKGVLSR